MEASIMPSKKPASFEYRHIKCAEGAVNAVMQQHGLFWWELVGTTTVVAKESHLEPATFMDEILGQGDTIYSVTTTERFATVDLKRDKSIPNLEMVKPVETQYFGIVRQLEGLGGSLVNGYAVPSYGIDYGGVVRRFLFPYWVWYEDAGCLGVILGGWPAIFKVFRRDGLGAGLLYLFLPVTSYLRKSKLLGEEKLANYLSLKEEMERLIEDHKEILNV